VVDLVLGDRLYFFFSSRPRMVVMILVRLAISRWLVLRKPSSVLEF
jgi:hypothetical protein